MCHPALGHESLAQHALSAARPADHESAAREHGRVAGQQQVGGMYVTMCADASMYNV